MHLGKGFCACDFMQGKKSFQHFVRKETLQSGLSTAHTKIKNKQIHLMTLNCGLNKGYYFRATCNDHSYKLTLSKQFRTAGSTLDPLKAALS